jgi:UDP-glucose 4-epimerase
MNCLVTGGAGFIGSHLVEALLARGHTVRVFDNLSTGSRANLATVAGRVELLVGDVIDEDALAGAMYGVQVVFHQAALASVPRSIADPWATHQACASGTLQVLQAARKAKVRRVVYAASSSAYGNSERLPKCETDPTNPLSPYAVSKLAGEHYCAAFTNVYGLETVRLRYFNVFGPRQPPDSPYAAVIPRFVQAMSAGRPAQVHGDGLQSRDFTYITDVVQANLLAAEVPGIGGRLYNVAAGTDRPDQPHARHAHQAAARRPPARRRAPQPGGHQPCLHRTRLSAADRHRNRRTALCGVVYESEQRSEESAACGGVT